MGETDLKICLYYDLFTINCLNSYLTFYLFFSSFTERFGYRKQRQLFFDKLGSIYTVLCTILNMKLPKSGNMAIPYHLMKKLRADPFPTANLSK